MELRRIDRLPPYVFSIVNEMKAEARRRGEDIIDLGMGNPDLATPQPIVDKLTQAAQNARNHRYSASRGITKLRQAVCDWYERRFDVLLDPEREALVSIGAKEGLAHLMWVLLRSGDSALVPSPSYPIHQFSCIFAGAEVTSVPLTHDTADFFADLLDAYQRTWPRPRVILVSFPHNPTGHCVDLDFFERLVAFFTGKPAAKSSARAAAPASNGRARLTVESAPKPKTEPKPARKPELVEVTSPKVYVGNLSFDAAESDLCELFSGVGSVTNAEIVSHRDTQKSKGFAFVTMASVDEAKRAVTELHDKEFMGRRLVISGAKTSDVRDSR